MLWGVFREEPVRLVPFPIHFPVREEELLTSARETQHSHTLMAAAVQVCACFLLVGLLIEASGKTPDVQITCLFSENCVLPCSFIPTGGEEIQWFRQDVLVYSHPQSSDQPSEQFEGRASMSIQQLALGNASVLLQRCGPQDRGRYRCRVVKGKEKNESFVIVKVEAPIHSVNIDITRLSGFEEVKCSTQDVYPAPRVSWSTEPPTPSDKLTPNTRIMANEQGLYAVESKLKRLKNHSDFTYICTINSSYSAQTWRTSLKETVINKVILTSKSHSFFEWAEISSAEGKDLTIPCKAPWVMQNFTMTWTFKLSRANEPTVICTYDSKTQLMSNQWEGRAWVDARTVQTGTASLRLLNPQSVEHTGTYTCIITGLQRRHEGQTAVNITSPARESERMEVKMESSTLWWVPAVVIVILAITAAFIVGILKLKDDCSHSNNAREARDSRQVGVTVTDSEAISEGSHLRADPTNEQEMKDVH
ncbi:uncharacterized protein hhla2b.1 [Colossoma macropomum]|uniref:uncharacterized protein hhla2b.1 n=1 Tax=Colossoma macropomum TaxID=42526 RepID=UPI0018646515|nr:uncharacterized protein hhla2b.1 [Colossoma macropomum]